MDGRQRESERNDEVGWVKGQDRDARAFHGTLHGVACNLTRHQSHLYPGRFMSSWCSGCSQQLHATQYRYSAMVVLPPVAGRAHCCSAGVSRTRVRSTPSWQKTLTRSQSKPLSEVSTGPSATASTMYASIGVPVPPLRNCIFCTAMVSIHGARINISFWRLYT